MERTAHVLMVGEGAERIADAANIPLCQPEDLVTARASDAWRNWTGQEGSTSASRLGRSAHGTVGAAAVDSRGALAAATSTGGYPRKLAGRVGDSCVLGAGFFASQAGAASATGLGEAIIKLALCRDAVTRLLAHSPGVAASAAIRSLGRLQGEGGIVIVDRKGRVGYAHNAQSMQVAIFDSRGGVRHVTVDPQTQGRHDDGRR